MTSEADTVVLPIRYKPLKQLNRIAKRPTLDIEFEDLSYFIRESDVKEGRRQILNSISGKFCSGELTAILGPSGAGKSTILNILAGFVTAGVRGNVKINGEPRDMKRFNKLSSYIMQENVIQPFLTVKEAMTFAASLKLGGHINHHDRIAVVEEVMDLLGLEKCHDTRSEYLSGGQRKRLSIALELVNNPPVIFLDEPTTGLDNYAMKQCIDLLKKISLLGRTVICTIHQPSASLFQCFDQVYFVADGCCVYNGTPQQLIPFFSTVGYVCPSNYTPADFMIELVHSQPTLIKSCTLAIQNGKINMKPTKDEAKNNRLNDTKIDDNNTEDKMMNKDNTAFINTPMRFQLLVLLTRMFLQMKRNNMGLYLQLIHHVCAGILIGGTFFGTGNNALHTISLIKYCVCCNVFFLFTYVMIPVLLFPLEVQLLRMEYFNRWYTLKAYYLAMNLANLPLMIILSLIFCTLVYFMVGNPMEMDRFIGFYLINIALALTSQGLGYLIGSVCSISIGSVVAPSVITPFLVLAIGRMGYFRTPIEPFFVLLMKFTYVRNGIVGLCNALFFKREPLSCPESQFLCIFPNPSTLMKDMYIPVLDYKSQLGIIMISMILFRIVIYLFLKCRLNMDLSSTIAYYTKKIIKLRIKI